MNRPKPRASSLLNLPGRRFLREPPAFFYIHTMPAEKNVIGSNYLRSCMGPHADDAPTVEVDPPRPLILKALESLRARAQQTRETAIAITKLEEAHMWLSR
jgi:hypothetical protein